jgi:hypothetical protein
MLASLATLLPLYPCLHSTRASTSVTLVVDGADETLRRANSPGHDDSRTSNYIYAWNECRPQPIKSC